MQSKRRRTTSFRSWIDWKACWGNMLGLTWLGKHTFHSFSRALSAKMPLSDTLSRPKPPSPYPPSPPPCSALVLYVSSIASTWALKSQQHVLGHLLFACYSCADMAMAVSWGLQRDSPCDCWYVVPWSVNEQQQVQTTVSNQQV